ncbi:MAG: thioredoxin domain-containing protein, partial [Pseudomonadota bacterium]
MMIKLANLTLPLVATVAAGVAVAAEDDFDERVRAYILNNPEVIIEALERLSAREEQAAMVANLAGFPELFSDVPTLGIGAPDAPLLVVEFFDYNCPYCRRAKPFIEALLEQDPNVRLVYREWPILGEGSVFAARAA